MSNAWNPLVNYAGSKIGVCMGGTVLKDCIILNGVWMWMFWYLKAGDIWMIYLSPKPKENLCREKNLHDDISLVKTFQLEKMFLPKLNQLSAFSKCQMLS